MSAVDAAPSAPVGVPSAPRAALAGVVAVGAALALVELIAGVTTRVPSAVDAVSQQVIPYSPQAVTSWAIATFGTSDTAVLNGGTTVIALLIGAVAGIAARRRPATAVALFLAFALLGHLAMDARSEASSVLSALSLLLAVGLGLAVLRSLLVLAASARHATGDATAATDDGRRRFLLAVAGGAAGVAVAAGVGRFVLARELAVIDPREIALPTPARALPAASDAASLDVDGLTPLFVPNDRFYRIDTAVTVPQIDPSTWSLRIHGLVEREVELTYDDVLELPLVEVDCTIACVSNEVGGDLVGNARWLGTPLDALLDRAGVRPEGVQLVGRDGQGFTVGFPTEAVYDGRPAILAVGMNGDPLPTRHGFPARLIVPGLYGYVSATKWITEIELVTADFDAYWVPRGWAKEGPIKTQSRIDVPRSGDRVPSGRTTVAGVAWAPTRGIERVEVRLDGEGGWVEAELSEPLSDDSWVQWVARLDDVATGDHVVQVRATDGDGETQTSDTAPPMPDGATGWDRVTFRSA